MNKKGDILVGNVVFIILNVIYLSILVIFLYTQGSGVKIVEETYAKEIALLVDYSQPGMFFYLDMGKAYDIAEERNVDFDKIVSKDENLITVTLDSSNNRKGYSYSFFNNVNVVITPQKEKKIYVFSIEEK